ncbi:glycosyltransferase family 2 protein [Streptomyces sp. NPDC048248]|uniref:glycosyltransferase family 2 protein n=1 Tax=Streptomyces sp. NPDC048248 TaxID=3365523 RepID=UPI003719A53A
MVKPSSSARPIDLVSSRPASPVVPGAGTLRQAAVHPIESAQMKVSVVIPSCNWRKYVWTCLLMQNHQVVDSSRKVEIVADDWSDDDAESAVKEFNLPSLHTLRTHVSGRASVCNDGNPVATPGFPESAGSADLLVIDRTGPTASAAAVRCTESDGALGHPPLEAEFDRVLAAYSLAPGLGDAACRR